MSIGKSLAATGVALTMSACAAQQGSEIDSTAPEALQTAVTLYGERFGVPCFDMEIEEDLNAPMELEGYNYVIIVGPLTTADTVDVEFVPQREELLAAQVAAEACTVGLVRFDEPLVTEDDERIIERNGFTLSVESPDGSTREVNDLAWIATAEFAEAAVGHDLAFIDDDGTMEEKRALLRVVMERTDLGLDELQQLFHDGDIMTLAKRFYGEDVDIRPEDVLILAALKFERK